MSDAEFFLLGWAVTTTILMFKYKAERDAVRDTLMHFIRDSKAREYVLKKWEEHKRAHGA